MGRAVDTILPARFLLTIGYFVVTVMAFSSVDACASAGLPVDASAEDYDAARQSMTAALALSLISFIVQFFGLLLGFSLFSDGSNLFTSILNFFGGVLSGWAIADQWGYTSFWAIVVPFSLLPGFMEAWTISRQLLRNRSKL